MGKFNFKPASFVPFRDKEVLERVRNIKRADIEAHPNPDFKIKVVPDSEVDFIWVTDMFHRILKAREEGRKVVMILPNPAPIYTRVAYLINKFQVDCSHLYTFNMDEWADDQGNIAPVDYPQGFYNSTIRYLYNQIDKKLRPKIEQIVGPTTKNINSYSKMIEDAGGADVCYSGPGWTGHLAFIEPDVPEFDYPLDEWKKLGARVTSLSPFTIAQNSLHGSFGMSGDIANVPPKAATIGPADVLATRNRLDFHALSVAGTHVAWQRMTTRLVLHGPVTPKIPESILQTVPTDAYVSETIAADIRPDYDVHY